MKNRAGTVLRIALPLRALTQRFAFLFLILAAFGLMLLSKAETVVMERMRAGVIDVVAPIMDAASNPVATVAETIENFWRLVDLHAENNRLREQNARLLQWQAAARKLAAENQSLRTQLNYVPSPRERYSSARVIAASGGVFVRSVVINAGARQGILKGQAVVTGNGLAGRIVSVGGGSARVLLITDLNSRIPVVVSGERQRAILAGDNSDKPKLAFLNRNAGIKPGDRVVTSGHGGVLPPNLPVGIVTSVRDGKLRVLPMVRLGRLEYVRIIDFRPATSGPDDTDKTADSGAAATPAPTPTPAP